MSSYYREIPVVVPIEQKEKRFKIEKIEKYNKDIKTENGKLLALSGAQTMLEIITMIILVSIHNSADLSGILTLLLATGVNVFSITTIAETISNKTLLKFNKEKLLEELQELENQQNLERKSR